MVDAWYRLLQVLGTGCWWKSINKRERESYYHILNLVEYLFVKFYL
jgi:hypothetical protein